MRFRLVVLLTSIVMALPSAMAATALADAEAQAVPPAPSAVSLPTAPQGGGQQQTPPPPPPTPPAVARPSPAQQPAPRPLTSGDPVNIRLDLTLTDTYTGAPSSKTVTMLIANHQSGMIRTSNRLPNGMGVKLNVDAQAGSSAAGDAVQVRLTFEYTPAQPPASDTSRAMPAELHESLTVWLKNGQSLMVSQSADPATERKVTVELKATILKEPVPAAGR